MNNVKKHKEKTMNKLTKIGASALCGSLAAISSANAGEMTVSGGVDMSWISYDNQVTGNPIGMGSNLSFAGSGELDNGWGVALSIAHNNKNTYSNTTVTVTVPSIGDILVSQGVSGTGIDVMDDVTPNVWEEAYATGIGSGINTISGVSGSSNIQITPSAFMPDGLTAVIALSPNAGGSGASDKASSGATGSPKQGGYDLTLTATDALTGIEGLTLYFGTSQIEQDETTTNIDGDVEEDTWAIKYAVSNFTVGYQWSEEDLGTSANAQQYENDAYGVTFQVNDNLSVGANHYKSKQTTTVNTEAEATSYQVAYTMGGASIRVASSSVDNASYQTTTLYDKDATTISVSLAF